MNNKGVVGGDNEVDLLSGFATGKRTVTPQLIETVLTIIPTLSCKVTDTLNWKELTIGEEFTLEIDREHLVKGNSYIFSSEHLVIFAYMNLPGTIASTSSTGPLRRSSFTLPSLLPNHHHPPPPPPPVQPIPTLPPRKIRVIVKYHLMKQTGDTLIVKNMTPSHCEDIIRNYNTMHSYLTARHKENQFTNIEVVGVCIAESKTKGWLWNTNNAHLWIEEYIPYFTRMWHKPPKLHIHLVATTDHIDLCQLQQAFFNEQKERFTIADLQGGCQEIAPGQYAYILCDIEYTNTLQKFGKIGDPYYTNRELLTIARRQWNVMKGGKTSYCIVS